MCLYILFSKAATMSCDLTTGKIPTYKVTCETKPQGCLCAWGWSASLSVCRYNTFDESLGTPPGKVEYLKYGNLVPFRAQCEMLSISFFCKKLTVQCNTKSHIAICDGYILVFLLTKEFKKLCTVCDGVCRWH